MTSCTPRSRLMRGLRALSVRSVYLTTCARQVHGPLTDSAATTLDSSPVHLCTQCTVGFHLTPGALNTPSPLLSFVRCTRCTEQKEPSCCWIGAPDRAPSTAPDVGAQVHGEVGGEG